MFRRFRTHSRGNVAITFAIAILPMIAAIGCAIDYSLANRMKAKLQAAADAASVAAVSKSSAGYKAANSMSQDGSVAAGVTDANAVFNGSAATFSGYSNLAVTSTVVKTGATLKSNVQFSATIPTVFLGILGYSSLTLTGTSISSAGLPLY